MYIGYFTYIFKNWHLSHIWIDNQHPHPLWVSHGFHELPASLYTCIAQFKFLSGSHGALPPLHSQLQLFICQSPTSVEPSLQ